MNVLTFDNPQLSQPTIEPVTTENPLAVTTQTGVTAATSQYLQAAISNNTRRAYCSDVAHFVTWGGTIPASPETVTAYITNHAGIVKSTTLVRRLVSVGRAHTSQGLENPCKCDLVKITLRGIKRVHGSASRQAAPAVREDILLMVDRLHGLKGIRDRALPCATSRLRISCSTSQATPAPRRKWRYGSPGPGVGRLRRSRKISRVEMRWNRLLATSSPTKDWRATSSKARRKMRRMRLRAGLAAIRAGS